MTLIRSKEEKNDILIEKFFLGSPSSLFWAQHLSRADVGFLSCLEIQVSFSQVCSNNKHPRGVIEHSGASLSVNCDSSVFQLTILMEFVFHGGNLNCYDWDESGQILALHSPTHWLDKWWFYTKARSSLGNLGTFLGWTSSWLNHQGSSAFSFPPREAPFVFFKLSTLRE